MGEENIFKDASMIHSPDEPESWFKPKYLTRTEKDLPQFTTEQETALLDEQIEASEGFDIDYTMFRCLFNYHPVDLDADEFVEEPETNADLLKRLSQKSLDDYNQENQTKYEFVKPLYANFHMSGCGVMFLITFQVKDPHADDNLTKEFQARVYYSFHYENKYVLCRPKQRSFVATKIVLEMPRKMLGNQEFELELRMFESLDAGAGTG